ncbi:murein L,D-transpeptidase [Aureimonas fodinaquatilis]|uniref:Murein L,D-transpeptidase n=1 Tax=Aureimonas fodinaquatilis TaxID=2565783 RepID=A0A5B0E1F2_9HYPH|nr:murein L,D-transpeptidase family protein [Aureimonas fodinaquatilis]KAA0971610.1 murein L,D-transpeptidase [Aureimonas fodinaquatilis]
MFARRLATAACLATGLLVIAGCKPGSIDDLMGPTAPLSSALLKQMQELDMGKGSPMMVRLFKEESELEVWKQTTSGSYALLKTYTICAWSGKLGPKRKEGDRQAPEGFYNITQGSLNPRSQHHLAFDIGYPNRYDSANGFTGQHLMVHGSCNSSGCYAMDNNQIEEIYSLARESFSAGQRNFQFQAYPFRMTPKNMARHSQSEYAPFWAMLKQGYDAFEVTKRPVKVDVCEKRYLFNASLPEGTTLNPAGACPTVNESPAMAARRIADEAETSALLARMTPADFALQSTFTYRTGDPITAEAYAREQNRREGYDRLGNRTTPARTSMFRSLLAN